MTKIERFYEWAIRASFFGIYVWFGWPKLFGLSPATQLVTDLLHVVLPTFPPHEFLVLFGELEILIGIAFLFPKITKPVIYVTAAHLVTTMLPLILLPQDTWAHFGVLNIEGQYVFKNVMLFTALLGLWLIEEQKKKLKIMKEEFKREKPVDSSEDGK